MYRTVLESEIYVLQHFCYQNNITTHGTALLLHTQLFGGVLVRGSCLRVEATEVLLESCHKNCHYFVACSKIHRQRRRRRRGCFFLSQKWVAACDLACAAAHRASSGWLRHCDVAPGCEPAAATTTCIFRTPQWVVLATHVGVGRVPSRIPRGSTHGPVGA